jgi:hypothetical protein
LETDLPIALSKVWHGANSAFTEAPDGLGQYSSAFIKLRPTAVPTTHIASRAVPKSWLFMAMIPLARSNNDRPADWFLECVIAVRHGRRSHQAVVSLSVAPSFSGAVLLS